MTKEERSRLATERNIRIGKIPPVKFGEENNNWKGDSISYKGIHTWITRKKGSPKKCEHCKTELIDKRYHWANINHKYRRILEDYIRLCTMCHRKYDMLHNGWDGMERIK